MTLNRSAKNVKHANLSRECHSMYHSTHGSSQVTPGSLHIDFAGPFLSSMFMIIVDLYTKWLEVFCMSQITTQATVTRFKRLFASYGLPEQIVTDNAPTFTSEEFQTFVTQNGILHTTSAPGHRAKNGMAERYVKTFKLRTKSSPACPVASRTNCRCFCCSTGPLQTALRVSLQLTYFSTDTSAPGWMS